MIFLLLCGRAPTLSNATRPYPKPWKNCKTWKNAFFAILREVAKLWKNCKTWKNAFFLVCGKAPALSNAIRLYFIQTLEKLQKP